MKTIKQTKGITLISLVITIIVLLILAGITISLTIGQDGIISKAQQAGRDTKLAEIKDKIKLDILTAQTEAIIRGESLEKEQLNEIIAKYGQLQEDGDTIITIENKFEISLKEIWNGELSDSENNIETANTNKPELLWTNPTVQAQETFTVECDYSKYDKILVLVRPYYGHQNISDYIVCCDISVTTEGWKIYAPLISGGNNYYVERTITFGENVITFYASKDSNRYSYGIPLKIWGMKTDTDMYTYP